jgi:hypothetical protein
MDVFTHVRVLFLSFALIANDILSVRLFLVATRQDSKLIFLFIGHRLMILQLENKLTWVEIDWRLCLDR